MRNTDFTSPARASQSHMPTLVVAVCAFLLTACEFTPAPEHPRPAMSSYAAPDDGPKPLAQTNVTVSLVGVTIAPGKADGTQWDGFGRRVSAETGAQIARAFLQPSPYLAVINALSGPAMRALSKPDAFGRAELYVEGQQLHRFRLNKIQDSFTPQWGAIKWTDVALRNARLRVQIVDADLANDDPIGIIELNSNDLAKALRAGKVLQISVRDQTNGQLLFVGISVR